VRLLALAARLDRPPTVADLVERDPAGCLECPRGVPLDQRLQALAMSTELLDGTWEVVPCAVGGLLWPYGIYLIAYLVAIPNDRRPPCDVNLSMTESFLRDSSTAFDFLCCAFTQTHATGGSTLRS